MLNGYNKYNNVTPDAVQKESDIPQEKSYHIIREHRYCRWLIQDDNYTYPGIQNKSCG